MRVAIVTLSLAVPLLAQRGPLPGIPLIPPPVDHPALAGQPLFQPPKPAPAPPPPAANPNPGAVPGAAPIDPDTTGIKVAGSGLVAEVAKVMTLPWHTDLAAALAEAKASGKPLFWLQGLGKLDGLAGSALQSLRGVTLANALVHDELRQHFVLGHADLESAQHVGLSAGYRPDQSAMGTSNGAGGRNLQLFVLDGDGVVLHALPGFWHPLDLLPELQLARQLHGLHASADHTDKQKLAMARVMHRAVVRDATSGTHSRSRWRDVDAAAEQALVGGKPRDTFVLGDKGLPKRDANGLVELAPLLRVVHERALAQLFVPFAAFDVERFVDYGVVLHDDNATSEVGVPFPGAVKNQQRRAGKARLKRP